MPKGDTGVPAGFAVTSAGGVGALPTGDFQSLLVGGSIQVAEDRDILIGSGLAETVYGGRGDDRMAGAAGADRLFGTAETTASASPPGGRHAAGNFVKGTNPKAADTNAFVLYATDDRSLFLNRDGTGAAAVRLAGPSTSTSLTVEDFVVVWPTFNHPVERRIRGAAARTGLGTPVFSETWPSRGAA